MKTNLKPSKPGKPYWQMNARELAAATREFNKPIDLRKYTRPLTPQERAMFQRMQKGPVISIHARPRHARQVKVKLDEPTFQRCQDYASRHDLTISDVISLSLQTTFRFAD